jgi:hypothetical protein
MHVVTQVAPKNVMKYLALGFSPALKLLSFLIRVAQHEADDDYYAKKPDC